MKQFFDTNKALWDAKVKWHLDSAFYDMPGFLQGNTSLMPTELREVGDVSGKSLLHLQCHFGQDTLSWARLGANVVGVDFSTEALKAARQINEQLGLPATFVESNVLELNLNRQFDVVFTSYGAICWLDNLDVWASVIARHLKPDGFFYMVDFHPTYMMFNFETIQVEYPYFNVGAHYEKTKGTYAEKDAEIEKDEYFWNHPMSEVINALIKNGLSLEFLNEYPYSHYNCYPNLHQESDKHWVINGYEKMLPMMFSLKAKKRLPL